MDSSSDENTNARTLYVGNLDPSVSEELLMALFAQIGPCKNCKIIHESTIDPYAFIEFADHQAAAHALLAMNKRVVMGREIKVNWATSSTSATNKTDSNKHYHIFVGDIAPDIDQNALHEAFSPFGTISEIKIAKFPDTQRSKGYCFIAFTNQNDAETAIASMNGQWLGTRKIRTNWATRKSSTNEPAQNRDPMISQPDQESTTTKLDFNEVWNRTRDTNRTVYFGGCVQVNEDIVRSLFAPFGPIQEIRVFKDKYAFIRFSSKESACQAICHLHGTEVQGQTIKCSWGRDEQANDHNDGEAYGNNNMNNQNYYKNNNNNNQYDSYSQNSYGPPMNNNHYMGDDRNGYGNYGSQYQQSNYPQPQYSNPQQWNNPNPIWDSYSQPMSNNGNWNNNDNNNYYYPPNFNQYNNPQQSQMYSYNSGWGSSRR